MKILLISKTYPLSAECGGTGTMAKVVAEGMVARGHEVTVLASERSPSAVIGEVRVLGRLIVDQPPPGKPVAEWTWWDKTLWIRKARHNYAMVAGQVRALSPDLVYLNDIELLTGSVFAAAVEAGTKCLWHAHDRVLRDMLSRTQEAGPTTVKRRVVQRLVHSVDASCFFSTPMIAVSHSVADDYRRVGWPSDLISVVPNGLPDYFFSHSPRLGPDREEWPLLFVGRCVEDKGIHVLLQVLDQLRRRGVSARLLMVGAFGDDTAQSHFMAEAERAGLADHVRVCGPIGRQELPAIYAVAGCLLVPSLIPEGFGLVSIEAQACGTPVIASRVGGLPETLVDGETGLLCEPGDAECMADLAERLHSDTALWKAMSAAGEKFARTRFQIADKLDRIGQIIEKALDPP